MSESGGDLYRRKTLKNKMMVTKLVNKAMPISPMVIQGEAIIMLISKTIVSAKYNPKNLLSLTANQAMNGNNMMK